MKRIFTILLVAIACFQWSSANLYFYKQEWQTDTVQRRQIGPGIINTIIRLPELPLNFYVLEMDLSNPHNRVETTIGQNRIGTTERLSDAVVRNRTATKRPVAACNANFWYTSSSGVASKYALSSPAGGVVRNDTTFANTNTSCDQWAGGPLNSGVSAVTHDNRVYMGPSWWYGIVTCDKINDGAPQNFYNVNRRCVQGEMALWNGAYTATRQFEDDWINPNERGTNDANNYYLTLAPGSSWATNAPMHFIVSRIVLAADRQTLGSYDACLTTTGGMKDVMAPLEVGDELTISSSWFIVQGGQQVDVGAIESLVEGNATIMIDRQLTDRNFNEGYNSGTYSRTCYGTNSDGSMLYMIVVDQSNSPTLGRSKGCTTQTVCEIMKCLFPDVQQMVNYDAGGSAEMLVHGKVINTTTEGTPRGVCCGWMMEAVGEEDNEIAFVRFADFRIEVPIYSSYTPVILGYNARGELISEDVKGFTVECTDSVGMTNGDTYYANGNMYEGQLVVDYNGMRDTIRVNNVAAEPGIKVKPMILVDDRDYPIEVNAPVGFKNFMYDPSMLDWEVVDESVLTINNGVLRAKVNGETDIMCSVGEYRDTTLVRVEISPEEYVQQSLEDWAITGSGAKNFSQDGNVINFAYSSSRAPHITMNKDLTFYSLPDTVKITFTCGLPVDYVQLDLRNYNFPMQNFMKIEPEGGFAAGEPHTIYVDLATLGGAENVSTYPLTLKTIKFVPNKSQSKSGNYQLVFNDFVCHYTQRAPEPLQGDVNGDGNVDGSDINSLINVVLGKESADIYGGRADVNGDGIEDGSDINTLINIVLGK